MEAELKVMLDDLQSLKRSLHDPSHHDSIVKLQLRVEHLTGLAKSAAVRRTKVKDMSAEVVDSNPYSRLMALQQMGIVQNYERIREFSVAIVVCISLFFIVSFVIVDDSELEKAAITSSDALHEGLARELPEADKFHKLLALEETSILVDDIDDLRRQLDALNTS